ncbi:MAG TPA: ABC transporter ATP-binding protein [Thermoplasmata archaeon]|nr:ABC transporter ATP-binding protein [Thermoplasmata archaeon]
MSAAAAIEIRGLTKSFGTVRAVDSLDLTVKKGEVFGFLGPNGAGKTTTIKMILGLTRPEAGSVLIEGESLARKPHEIKRRIGYLPERVAFYDNLTALQTLEFYADIKGAPHDALESLLVSVGLGEFARKRVGTFSKGMRQLLGVAQAFIGEPSILIMDEPTSGLDPNWARKVKDRVAEASRKGVTVFFSSHMLSEVEELASRVAILNRGKTVAEDTVAKLRSSLELKPRMYLTLDGDSVAAGKAAEGVAGVGQIFWDGKSLIVESSPESKVKILMAIENAGVAVKDLRTAEPSLEEVFLRMTESAQGAIR